MAFRRWEHGRGISSFRRRDVAASKRNSSSFKARGISGGTSSTGFAFLQDVSDSPLQEVEVEPTSIADNLSEGFVNGGKVLADISEQFLLLTRARYFLRFSHQVTDHGIFGP